MAGANSGENFPEDSSDLAFDGVASRDELARAVLSRRKVELRLTQEEVRDRSGLSTGTVSKIEHGRPVSTTSLRRLDLALEWEVGTSESWLRGRAGVVTRPAEGADLEQMADALAPLVAARLQRGPRQEIVARKLAALPTSVVIAFEALVDQVAAVIVGQ